MRLLKYQCKGYQENDWEFTEVSFKSVNLLVGDSATGKTRFLNTIFNVCRFVASDDYRSGYWDITFEQAGQTYHWTLLSDKGTTPTDGTIRKEGLWAIDNDKEILIYERNDNLFLYDNKELPKISHRLTGISILREEPQIQPIFKGFENVLRRSFFSDELRRISQLEIITTSLVNKFKGKPEILIHSDLSLNSKLFILSGYFPKLFADIVQYYREAFPFIEEVSFEASSNNIFKELIVTAEIPMFCIKERHSNSKIALPEMSSGMQKVLLILSDIFLLPDDSIYLIDEYENSLGINAIDFFPNLLFTLEKKLQFIITSHHPYIINKIPPKNWYIFHRKGTHVSIMYGDELEKRFGTSKQKAFVQLINDPFYTGGIE